VPDDQVTIDPEFSPPSPGDGQGRWLRVAGVVAVGVAAFIFGWLLRSPAPTEPEAVEAAVTSTTALTGETTTSTTRSRPSSTTSTTVAEIVELGVPLGEAVRGFTDTIMMTHWDEERNGVLRWRASQTGPEKIASFDQEAGWFAGLDASGRWAAQVTWSGLLSVHPVPESIDERWPEGFDRAVDVRVASAVWHDRDPGRLAWVKCSRSVDDSDDGPLGVATLYSYDIAATDPGEPAPEFTIDGGCIAGWGISPQLGSWGDEGVRYWTEGEGPNEVLIRPDGTKVDLPPDAYPVVAPDGSAVVIDHDRLGESYLLSSDGTTRSPVPGLAADEWLDGVLWSPDGALLAYWSRWGEEGDPVIRIVEMDTGSVVAEVMTPDWESWPVTWSTDSRFLLFDQWPTEFDGGEPPEDAGKLMFYDITKGTSVTVPLPPQVGDIRTFEPVPAAEQFTPVEWGIAIDGAGPGIHLVAMEVDAPPVLPNQVEDLSGQLIWDETVVDLCNIGMEVRDGILHIGDTFGTDEGCGANPTAMQDAFDEYGLPETACLAVRVDGVDYEYCAPLSSGSPDDEIAALAAYPLLTVEDLPGEWHEAGTDAQFLLPEGLCSQIPTGQDIFPDTERPDSPNYSTPLAQARFVRAESSTWLNQGVYASGYMTVDQLFTHFETLLTDCAVETDGVVTTEDHTASIDLVDLPGLDRDYVAVEWSIDRVSWSSGKTRLVIVHLGDVLLVLNTYQEWWSSPEESVGVSDAEFEAIVQTAVARATSLTNE
jgi:hypothetical protein